MNTDADIARRFAGIAHEDKPDRDGNHDQAGCQSNPFERNQTVFDEDKTTNLVVKRFNSNALRLPSAETGPIAARLGLLRHNKPS